MLRKSYAICIASVLILLMASPALSAGNQVISGAGPSTKLVELFVKKFSRQPGAKGYSFEVPPKSTKHAGGIKNSDDYLFGRTGRPLNAREKALNKDEIFIARLPIVFVTGAKAGVRKLSLDQVQDMFTGKIDNWKAVGGPDHEILTIGREPTEALFVVLKANYPVFNNAKFDMLLKKDHLVVEFLMQPQGEYAIAFGAEPNFWKKKIKFLKVKGLSAGVEVGLVYDKKNEEHELVKAVIAYAKSKEWRDFVWSLGYLPPKLK